MAGGELGAAFKALAKSAAGAAERITAKVAQFAERTAEIEETNLGALARADQKAAQAITSAGRSPVNVLPSSGGTFVTTPGGRTYDVPSGWQGRVADNGKGLVFQKPGSTGNNDLIRIMDPTTTYPNGYARVHNEYGQPVDVNGKPRSRAETHIPAEYEGPWPAWPK
ncbi:hypothetical protein ACIA5C_44550 [Actinoplanes sp. NPDC051343]|uniref:hypothetical protein n=1 Tax=Actinoplanes sp. NPDC051343 TaxID=3363906 RepID=UPI0037A3D634